MRLQVTANDEMVKKIDKYADMMSVSRSALCAILIGQGLAGFDKVFGLVDDVTERIGSSILDEEQKKGVIDAMLK